MTELDYEKLGITYYGPVRLQRLIAMMEQMQVVQRYLRIRGEAEGPLTFHLGAGRRVYDLFNQDSAQVGAAEAPLAVYLDPRRLRGPNPLEWLFIGASTLDTFLARIDFAARPSFDANIYSRLRLEDLLRSLEQSNVEAFTMINLLGRFHQIQGVLRKGRRLSQPTLDTSYGFWGPRVVP